MTFDRRRHEEWEELISASLHDDLTDEERRRLDEHLERCAACQETLAAFASGRRIVAGLRHLPVPRDLGARVRAGVDAGRGARPWWRRPPAVLAGVGGGLAVAAGALLAVVLLGAPGDEAPIGAGSPTPTPVMESAAPSAAVPTLPPLGTPDPEASTPPASAESSPTASPVPASPEPDVFLALTGPFDNLAMTVRDGTSGDTLREVETTAGPPVAAQLSPDGQWLAYITEVGLSGLTEIRATRIAEPDGGPSSDVPVGDTVVLGSSVAGSPFLEGLAWSEDSHFLAFTVATPEGGTDAWLFDATRGEASALTDVGNAYAGSWAPETDASLLWISVADSTPRSYLLTVHDEAPVSPTDPDESAFPAADNVFLPQVSPNGGLVIYWIGGMAKSGDEYVFTEGGGPWLAENRGDGRGGFEFDSSRPLFSDVTLDRDAFSSAAIAWGPDGDSYAVWDATWTGISQAPVGDYPDPGRVYLGRATDPRGLTVVHAIDRDDIPSGWSVVDVAVGPSGRHLAITARRPLPGDFSAPAASLLLVTRNTGDVPDEVSIIGDADDGWFGPAVYRTGR